MWQIAGITFVCFVLSNIASTLMVQSESRNRAVASGFFEALYALFWIYAAKYALDTHPIELVALLAGNFLGAVIGVKIGERFVTDHGDVEMKNRLAEAESALNLAHEALAELEDEVDLHHGNNENH